MSVLDYGKCALARCTLSATVLFCASASPVAVANGDASAVQQAAWREEISSTPSPDAEGCFEADYPSTAWVEVACVEAPHVPYLPTVASGRGETVGHGNDYAALVDPQLIVDTKGSFPHVTVVTSEEDDGVANIYSLQINSYYMHTLACQGHPNCRAWQQFIYSSGARAAFMQYWLLDWDAACPPGWFKSGSNCWSDSAAVRVPRNSILSLPKMSLYASASIAGGDKLTFTGPSHAYSVTASDGVLLLATDWHASEFNVLGDGNGTEAIFNRGSHTERVLVHHGSIGVLSCTVGSATSRETNNLHLGTCGVTHGSNPYLTIEESN